MRIRQISVDKIIPYPGNPRKNQAAIDPVAASLREFGWQQPIVVDSDMVVIVGHTRLLPARQLGLDKVPVTVAEDMTPAQARAYRLADNRTGENAEWDNDLLAIELGELEGDFDLSLTGFSPEELQALMHVGTGGNTAEDETPEPPADPVTVTGDVWLMNKHRPRVSP